MLKIFVSKKFLEEKKYILEVFLKHILKVKYEIKIQETDSYLAELPNGNKLEISDFFFKFLSEDESYCKNRRY